MDWTGAKLQWQFTCLICCANVLYRKFRLCKAYCSHLTWNYIQEHSWFNSHTRAPLYSCDLIHIFRGKCLFLCFLTSIVRIIHSLFEAYWNFISHWIRIHIFGFDTSSVEFGTNSVRFTCRMGRFESISTHWPILAVSSASWMLNIEAYIFCVEFGWNIKL